MPEAAASGTVETIETGRVAGGVTEPRRHDSAHKHVSGEAAYIDDMPEPAGLLHVYLGLSERAHARIVSLSLSDVCKMPGVVMVLTAADIPGCNDISPTRRDDEPVFAGEIVDYHGQPLFAVVADTRDHARRAVRRARVEYEDLPAKLDIAAARRTDETVTPGLTLQRGDVEAAIAAAPYRIEGQIVTGGQDHFYLEGQIALAIPGEDDEVLVHASTQHPSEIQHMVAHVLGVPSNAVTAEVRRMGGGFGGKETQGNLFAVVAALAASKTGKAAKIRPDRDDDMVITGKRHDFVVDYRAGFDDDGRIKGADFVFAARCGYSSDLSGPVTDRALFHADNAYYYDAARMVSLPLRTNTCSNTAFRGFGGPQGMVAGERVIEEIAFALGKDPLEVRKANLYGRDERNITPYHQTVKDSIIGEIIEELETSAEYWKRRAAIRTFNVDNRVIRRGLALTPVKFGISFTATHFNQAGALIHVYTDGTIHLNHGGTEMGQGLFTKVAQVVAEEFQVDLDRVRITATTTAKVPNTSATAASAGSDLNGMATQAAVRTIKTRLIDFAAERWAVPRDQVVFLPNRVRIGNEEMPFAELVKAAYFARVSLSSTGFYRTPDIHWDRETGQGRPFYYFAYGASVSEVSVDLLTGEYRVDRVDILHDVGRSLNPAIDRGQVEGGFIQGMGWLTTEELWWDAEGRLRTHAPSTYKIPVSGDRPRIFNVKLLEGATNREETVYRSKAVGEPPLMLAISVLHALSDAIASIADHRLCPRLDAPDSASGRNHGLSACGEANGRIAGHGNGEGWMSGETPAGTDARLQLRKISKRFPGVLANDSVDLSVAPGEIHALLGENGAGKSTLVKIIYGVLHADEGEMLWEGEPVTVADPHAARNLGIGMVFQHFSLFEAMTVLENIALGVEKVSDMKALAERVIEVSHAYGLPLDPDREVHTLSVGERQRIEIVRCLLQNPRLLIMDEPTSVLTPQEVERLFETLRQLASEGVSILYISHKLDEIKALCDRATILRGGKVVAACDPKQETAKSLAAMMIGAEVRTLSRRPGSSSDTVRLEVQGLNLDADHAFGVSLKDITFSVRAGEIFGIAGVAGNGQNELFQALTGERPVRVAGAVVIDATPAGRIGAASRRRLGMCSVPEERNGHAAVPEMSLVENFILSGYRRMKLLAGGFVRNDAAAALTGRVVQEFDVRTASVGASAGSLSGGNLQKFIVGREIVQEPGVLVVSQPTWGVDAGAAAAIHQALFALAENGSAVVVISQDLDELLTLSDHLAVINLGALSPNMVTAEASIDEIGLLMGGLHGMTEHQPGRDGGQANAS